MFNGKQGRVIGRAMAEQVQRVKGASDGVPTLRDWQSESPELVRLSEQLRAANEEIARLREQVRNLLGEQPTDHLHNGRPVIDTHTAHERTGLSIATITRYCKSGYWQAYQAESRQWLIYDDQPLMPKPKARKVE